MGIRTEFPIHTLKFLGTKLDLRIRRKSFETNMNELKYFQRLLRNKTVFKTVHNLVARDRFISSNKSLQRPMSYYVTKHPIWFSKSVNSHRRNMTKNNLI